MSDKTKMSDKQPDIICLEIGIKRLQRWLFQAFLIMCKTFSMQEDKMVSFQLIIENNKQMAMIYDINLIPFSMK